MNSILYEKEITVNAIDSAYEKGKKEGTIEELENIKKEIRENVFCYDKEQIIRLIIDKHIEELKPLHYTKGSNTVCRYSNQALML